MRGRFNRTQRNYIILGLCSILLLMAIGYAAFRSQLTINGTSNIGSEWNVLITDIESNVLSGQAEDVELPHSDGTTATFKTNLVSPGDSMQYDIKVENQGSIDAVLKSITKTDSNNDAIVFEISGIEQGDVLKADDYTIMHVTVTYNSSITSQPNTLTSDLELTLDYVQAGTTDEGEVLPAETNLMRNYSEGSQLDYHNDAYREKITSIEILDNKNVPSSDAVQSWDVSERQDESVMAWIVNDTENEGYYKLYIGGDGGVIANPNSSHLFANFRQAENIDLSNLDTSHVTNMAKMFLNCEKLSTLYISNFDTNNVTDMGGMFNNTYELTSLDLSGFKTTKVTNMEGMFSGDRNLTSISFGQTFDTSKVTNMKNMFNCCYALTNLDVSHFNTSNVTIMTRMFSNCYALTSLDLSNFDTSNVIEMGSMFEKTNFTSLDLSSFDTSNVTSMTWMFSGATSLQNIYVGPKWSTDGTDTYLMFSNCGTDHVTLKQS